MQTCARVLLGDRCTLLHTAAKHTSTAANTTTATTAAAAITSSAAATVSSTQARHFIAEVDEPASGLAQCRTYVIIQNNSCCDSGEAGNGSSSDVIAQQQQQQQQQQGDIALWYSVLQQAVEKGIESVNNNNDSVNNNNSVNNNSSSNNYIRGNQVSSTKTISHETYTYILVYNASCKVLHDITVNYASTI
jgi:hypothetical protein